MFCGDLSESDQIYENRSILTGRRGRLPTAGSSESHYGRKPERGRGHSSSTIAYKEKSGL